MRAGRRGDGTERIDIRLVGDPIDFLAEEHMRQRIVLADLDRLAAADAPDPATAAAALLHLREEMPAHAMDEDEDLFPLLRRRAMPEDDLEELIARLGADHAESARRMKAVCRILDRIAAGERPAATDRRRIADHAAAERRHLIVENAIILPLARARLTAADRRDLSRRMAARRGICLLPEPDDA